MNDENEIDNRTITVIKLDPKQKFPYSEDSSTKSVTIGKITMTYDDKIEQLEKEMISDMSDLIIDMEVLDVQVFEKTFTEIYYEYKELIRQEKINYLNKIKEQLCI